MVTVSQLQNDVQQAIDSAGVICRFKYFNYAYPGAGSYYDDGITLTQSGSSLWVSGLVSPVGGKEAHLVQQGLLKNDDKVLYVLGTVGTSGLWQVGIGSGTPTDEYGLIESVGVMSWQIGNVDVYKKCFLRRLSTGSVFI